MGQVMRVIWRVCVQDRVAWLLSFEVFWINREQLSPSLEVESH